MRLYRCVALECKRQPPIVFLVLFFLLSDSLIFYSADLRASLFFLSGGMGKRQGGNCVLASDHTRAVVRWRRLLAAKPFQPYRLVRRGVMSVRFHLG